MLKQWQDKLTIKNGIVWLASETRSVDTWLLFLAGINWLHVRFLLKEGPCNGIWSPWFCADWTWHNAPSRILIAALFLRSRKIGFMIAGFLIAAQLFAAQLFFIFSPDDFNILWLDHTLEALLKHEITQGCLAALLISFGLYRFFRHPSRHSRLLKWFKLVTATGLVILILGYVSNFISHGNAESLVAKWIMTDVIKNQTIYGACSQSRSQLVESASRFTSIGATVLKMDCNDSWKRTQRGEVGPSSFTGPFFILVRYEAMAADGNETSGYCLTLNFFGYSKILNTDSWRLVPRVLPYLWPY